MSGLEIVGSIASVAQLAGTVYTISKTLYEVGNALSNAPSDIKDLAGDLERFSEELHLYARLLDKKHYDDQFHRLTAKIIGECATICTKIDRVLRKLRSGKLWARVKWLYKEKEILKLLTRLRDLKFSLLSVLQLMKYLKADQEIDAIGGPNRSLLQASKEEGLSKETITQVDATRKKLAGISIAQEHDAPQSCPDTRSEAHSNRELAFIAEDEKDLGSQSTETLSSQTLRDNPVLESVLGTKDSSIISEETSSDHIAALALPNNPLMQNPNPSVQSFYSAFSYLDPGADDDHPSTTGSSELRKTEHAIHFQHSDGPHKRIDVENINLHLGLKADFVTSAMKHFGMSKEAADAWATASVTRIDLPQPGMHLLSEEISTTAPESCQPLLHHESLSPPLIEHSRDPPPCTASANTTNNADSSNVLIQMDDARSTSTTAFGSVNSYPQAMEQHASMEPATVLPAPHVINIRKGQAKKFNWKSGSKTVRQPSSPDRASDLNELGTLSTFYHSNSSSKKKSISFKSSKSSEKDGYSDWTDVTDIEERRRVQNRIAQTMFRKKTKQAKERQERDAENQAHAANSYNSPDPEEPGIDVELSGLPGEFCIAPVVPGGKRKTKKSNSRRESGIVLVATPPSPRIDHLKPMKPDTLLKEMSPGSDSTYQPRAYSQAHAQQPEEDIFRNLHDVPCSIGTDSNGMPTQRSRIPSTLSQPSKSSADVESEDHETLDIASKSGDKPFATIDGGYETSPTSSHNNRVPQNSDPRIMESFFSEHPDFSNMPSTGPKHWDQFSMPEAPGREFGVPSGWEMNFQTNNLTPVGEGVFRQPMGLGPLDQMDIGWPGAVSTNSMQASQNNFSRPAPSGFEDMNLEGGDAQFPNYTTTPQLPLLRIPEETYIPSLSYTQDNSPWCSSASDNTFSNHPDGSRNGRHWPKGRSGSLADWPSIASVASHDSLSTPPSYEEERQRNGEHPSIDFWSSDYLLYDSPISAADQITKSNEAMALKTHQKGPIERGSGESERAGSGRYSFTRPAGIYEADDEPLLFAMGETGGNQPRRSTQATRASEVSDSNAAIPIKYLPVEGRISRAKKGIPVHTCEMCRPVKTFTRAEHMRRHQLSHSKQTFACTFEDCERAFHRPDLLAGHVHRHETQGEKPYKAGDRSRASSSASEGQIPSLEVKTGPQNFNGISSTDSSAPKASSKYTDRTSERDFGISAPNYTPVNYPPGPPLPPHMRYRPQAHHMEGPIFSAVTPHHDHPPPPSAHQPKRQRSDDPNMSPYYGPPSVVGMVGMPSPAPRPRGPKLRFTPEDDQLLVDLKENKNLTWKQIAEFYPGRSSGTMQVRYSKLKAKTAQSTEETPSFSTFGRGNSPRPEEFDENVPHPPGSSMSVPSGYDTSNVQQLPLLRIPEQTSAPSLAANNDSPSHSSEADIYSDAEWQHLPRIGRAPSPSQPLVLDRAARAIKQGPQLFYTVQEAASRPPIILPLEDPPRRRRTRSQTARVPGPMKPPVDFVSGYTDHMMRPLMIDTMRRNEHDEHISPTGLSPAFDHVGYAPAGSMDTSDIPLSLGSNDRYKLVFPNLRIPATPGTILHLRDAGQLVSVAQSNDAYQHPAALSQMTRSFPPLLPLQLREAASAVSTEEKTAHESNPGFFRISPVSSLYHAGSSRVTPTMPTAIPNSRDPVPPPLAPPVRLGHLAHLLPSGVLNNEKRKEIRAILPSDVSGGKKKDEDPEFEPPKDDEGRNEEVKDLEDDGNELDEEEEPTTDYLPFQTTDMSRWFYATETRGGGNSYAPPLVLKPSLSTIEDAKAPVITKGSESVDSPGSGPQTGSMNDLRDLGTVKTPSKPVGAHRPPGARGTTTPLHFKREDEGGAAHHVSDGTANVGDISTPKYEPSMPPEQNEHSTSATLQRNPNSLHPQFVSWQPTELWWRAAAQSFLSGEDSAITAREAKGQSSRRGHSFQLSVTENRKPWNDPSNAAFDPRALFFGDKLKYLKDAWLKACYHHYCLVGSRNVVMANIDGDIARTTVASLERWFEKVGDIQSGTPLYRISEILKVMRSTLDFKVGGLIWTCFCQVIISLLENHRDDKDEFQNSTFSNLADLATLIARYNVMESMYHDWPGMTLEKHYEDSLISLCMIVLQYLDKVQEQSWWPWSAWDEEDSLKNYAAKIADADAACRGFTVTIVPDVVQRDRDRGTKRTMEDVEDSDDDSNSTLVGFDGEEASGELFSSAKRVKV